MWAPRGYWAIRWFADTRSFPERYLDNAKRGKNGKRKEWKEYKEPKVLHVMAPAVAVKRPITRNF